MSKADSDALPSYEESITSSSSHRPSSLAQTRATIVSSLIANHITPALQNSASLGLSSTTVILVPSNISALHPSPSTSSTSEKTHLPAFQGEKVITPPNSENATVRRLKDGDGTVEFLRQPAVLQMLREQLCGYLNQEGYGRIATDASGEQELAEAEVVLRIAVENVAMRIESDMGLYETRSGSCLIIRLNFKV